LRLYGQPVPSFAGERCTSNDMNPLYAAAIAAALGKQVHCSTCGKEQMISSQGAKARRYRCKKCGHVFTERELHGPSAAAKASRRGTR
jgi:transposase-like protein